jgi:hypothetical protein
MFFYCIILGLQQALVTFSVLGAVHICQALIDSCSRFSEFLQMFSVLSKFMRFGMLAQTPYVTFGGTLIGFDKGIVWQLNPTCWLEIMATFVFVIISVSDDAAKSWVIDSGADPNGMTRINLFDSAASQARVRIISIHRSI